MVAPRNYMNASIILWVYLALLLAGGLVGFLKAGSKASLIASSICGIPVLLCALGFFGRPAAIGVIAVLGLFFAAKFAKGRKFMPGGFMTLLSILALAGLLLSV